MTDHEEVRGAQDTAATSYPVVGDTTVGLGEHLLHIEKIKTPEAYARIRRGAVDIVRRCRRFDGPDGQMTGLVVGYVQSGKTMSMTAVSALARDNGCRIVILLAGVTTNLLVQNAERFRDDLRCCHATNTGDVGAYYERGTAAARSRAGPRGCQGPSSSAAASRS